MSHQINSRDYSIEINPSETPVQYFGRCANFLRKREEVNGYSGDGPNADELYEFYKTCAALWEDPVNPAWSDLMNIYNYQIEIVDKWVFREKDVLAINLCPVIEMVHRRIWLLLDDKYPETSSHRQKIESLRVVAYRANQMSHKRDESRKRFRFLWNKLFRFNSPI